MRTALCVVGAVTASFLPAQEPAKSKSNIVETAVSAGSFKTLVTAVKAAGLVDTLSGKGPFTVFAPNDAAFARLPAGTVESLLRPENKDKLVSILTYHVVAGRFEASDVVESSSLKSVQGGKLPLMVGDDGVRIANARILTTDVWASNGVIHVIDSVMMPKEAPTKSIVETAVANGSFKTLVAAVKAAGLADTLSGKGPFTVFAPTDAAFAKLPAGTVENLLKPENKQKLINILTYHVVPADVDAKTAAAVGVATTVQGQPLGIRIKDGKASVNGANIVSTDIETRNGTIHVIDTVILPPDVAGNLVDVAASGGSFNTLVAAVKAAGLVETLSGKGPFTIFAPTDAAFAKLPAGTVENLLKPENKQKLIDILTYHVVPGAVDAAAAARTDAATTVSGKDLKIKVKGGAVMVSGAKVLATDIKASNGILHVIDTVLLP